MIITISAFQAVQYLTRYVNSLIIPLFCIHVVAIRGTIDSEITNSSVVHLEYASSSIVLTLSCLYVKDL